MMPKLTAFVAVTLMLVACQQGPVRDETSYRSRVGIGSTFVLNESLMVPSGYARVFIQGGNVVAKARLNRYQPHCNFEIRTVSNGSSRIEPDTFLVTGVEEDEEEIVSRPEPLRYAAVGDNGNEGGANLIARFVRHWLYSERQPEVMRLTCHGGFDMPFYAQTPSIAEIRDALGKQVTLNLVQEE